MFNRCYASKSYSFLIYPKQAPYTVDSINGIRGQTSGSDCLTFRFIRTANFS